jgi:hypothetical protein
MSRWLKVKKCVPFLICRAENANSASRLLEKFVLRLADRVAAAVVIKERNYSFGGSRPETRTARYRKQMRAQPVYIRNGISDSREREFRRRKRKKSERGLYIILRIFSPAPPSLTKSQRPVSAVP